jgi:carbamate kinase
VSSIAVLALGGNALTREHERGSQEEQYANALTMAKSVRSLIRKGWRIIIVHGNGPQVGNLAIQNEESAAHVPAQPLFVLDAMTQGALGSLICLALQEVCGHEIPGAVSVVTHVVVDPDDAAFGHPTKPIGPFFNAEEARDLEASRGWQMASDAGRGYRRVVASPAPQSILEAAAISTLIASGHIVVAAGGGGIPVVRHGDAYRGIDAVIDKDFAAERIASAAGADALIMVTGVPTVKLDFGTPRERAVEVLTVAEARTHLAAGQFPPGSMGPKVSAAITFVDGTDGARGGRIAAITTPELVYATLDEPHGVIEGGRGTRIVPTPAAAEALR